MVVFRFRVNDSFLLYPARPITVPRSQVDYGQVLEMLVQDEDVWITLLNSNPVGGVAHWGLRGPNACTARCLGHESSSNRFY
jgi:hypothetical protein